jgi:hypothetical protein
MNDLALAAFFAIVACMIGGALGGFALARPRDALTLVGLKLDEDKAHSLAEARATYGGLFLLSHAGTAAALGYAPGVGACMALALALCWGGAAMGRGYSMVREGAATAFNLRALVFELAMAAALALPFWSYASLARNGGVIV